jgi:hypothetical protein
MGVSFWLSYTSCPVLAVLCILAVLFCLFCLPFLFCLSCLPILLCLSCFACLVCLSCFACPILSVRPVLPFLYCPSCSWLSCPGFHVLALLSRQSCSICPVLAVLFGMSCSGCSVLAVWFCLSCSGCPVLAVLSWPYIDARARNYERENQEPQMYKSKKSRSANKRVEKLSSVKQNAKNQGAQERKSANAKEQNLRPNKERESASVKSFPQERESASVKPKKKRWSALPTFRGLECTLIGVKFLSILYRMPCHSKEKFKSYFKLKSHF